MNYFPTLKGTSGNMNLKEICIAGAPTSTGSIQSRIYNIENAHDGDTLTGINENGTYLQIVSTSSDNHIVAKSNLTAVVVLGYDTANYTLRTYTTGETIATINRYSGHIMFVGVL